jgi:outer membrane protein assembly factor BamB
MCCRNLPCLAVLTMFAVCSTAWGRSAPAQSPSDTPLMALLDQFAAPDVPALGAAEQEVVPGKWDRLAPANLPGRGLAQHPMLYIGEGYNKIFLINQGKILWTYSTGKGNEYDDIWMLTNGHVLFTRMAYLCEVTPKKEVVWRYDAPAGTEIHTCQPIGLDKVLFVQNGLPPKAMMYDKKTGTVRTLHDLPAPSLTDPKTVHPQFRRFRMTAQGTYLAPFLTMNQVIEYDADFKEVWKYEIPTPWAALRLQNGNTLITDEKDKLTREVNPQGETVWEFKPSDMPSGIELINTQTCTRLANGNTIICSRGGNGKDPQLIEVTPDKKVVWVLQDWANLGPATAVQILDDPGIPEKPGDSQH